MFLRIFINERDSQMDRSVLHLRYQVNAISRFVCISKEKIAKLLPLLASLELAVSVPYRAYYHLVGRLM